MTLKIISKAVSLPRLQFWEKENFHKLQAIISIKIEILKNLKSLYEINFQSLYF